MAAQTTHERNRLAATRRVATDSLERTTESLARFLNPEDESFMASPELRRDPAVQMILGEIISEMRDALLLLRLERQCIRCEGIFPESEVRDGYCKGH